MHLVVNKKRTGHGNGINHNGSDNHMNQNGQGNLMSHNEQGIPMSNQGLYNSVNNVGNSIGNGSLNYASSGPPNTMNNTYGNQADGFWDSRNTAFNNGPGRDDTVNNFTSNNSSNAALNSFNNCWDSFVSGLLTLQPWFGQNIPYCGGPPPITNYSGDDNTSSATLLDSSSKSTCDFQKYGINLVQFSLNMESSAGSSVQSDYVNGSSNSQNISSSNLPAREAGIIESLQVSPFYIVFQTS